MVRGSGACSVHRRQQSRLIGLGVLAGHAVLAKGRRACALCFSCGGGTTPSTWYVPAPPPLAPTPPARPPAHQLIQRGSSPSGSQAQELRTSNGDQDFLEQHEVFYAVVTAVMAATPSVAAPVLDRVWKVRAMAHRVCTMGG